MIEKQTNTKEFLPTKPFLRKRDIQALFGVKSHTTIDAWRKKRRFPEPISVTDRVLLWDRQDIFKWIDSLDKRRKL